MHKLSVYPLLHLFPMAEAKHHTALSQQAMATYNMETLWDLLGVDQILNIPKGFRPCFFEKSTMLRSILGELQEYVDPPPDEPYPTAFTGVEHTLASYVATSLICEAIYVRMMEYVTRIEAVWREYGQELLPHPNRAKLIPGFRSDDYGYLIENAHYRATSEQG